MDTLLTQIIDVKRKSPKIKDGQEVYDTEFPFQVTLISRSKYQSVFTKNVEELATTLVLSCAIPITPSKQMYGLVISKGQFMTDGKVINYGKIHDIVSTTTGMPIEAVETKKMLDDFVKWESKQQK